ncbi:hypothetical protein N0B44_14260 [Roseibacterium beibuensis]|uniref:Toxin-antitoxin system HicB family antitoxin n=1 Tax=[Roseibacterium] beibuensis TaxID=1193142 RepID=A0ABP9LA87_9RHOB|nr:hypothetical protein [Roseibacterium beibuensis]MCS6624078.1 hypothetical protein [Roseibacterium beibuensis]
MARITIRLPQSLKAAAGEFAEWDGVSLNHFIALALAEKVGIMGGAEFFAVRSKGADAERAVRLLEGRPG